MAISSSASFNNRVTYTVTDSKGNTSQSDSDSQTITTSYTHGTGNFQINTAASISGTLSSGEHKTINLYNDGTGVLSVNFGVTGGVPINRIKHLSVYNLSTAQGDNIQINTTGSDSIAGILGDAVGTSGIQNIRPYSSFAFNDPYNGVTISDTEPNIYINDVAGQGAKFKILIMGVDVTQPTGNQSSPY